MELTRSYLLPGTDAYPFPVLPVSLALLESQHKQAQGVTRYKLGGKASADTSPKGIISVDCSGYVGWLLARSVQSSNPATFNRDVIGRGSWQLSQWAKSCGFKRSTVDSGKLKDGALRLAVMLATPVIPIGHIALVLDGMTLESHGGIGVDSRVWNGERWQARCSLYVLTAPRVAR